MPLRFQKTIREDSLPGAFFTRLLSLSYFLILQAYQDIYIKTTVILISTTSTVLTMATLKNIIVSLLLATAVIAAPTAVEESSLSSPLVPRKNANKCEAHIYIDSKMNSLLSNQ